jgi:hypothetical protein
VTDELKPCPFCGKPPALSPDKAQDFFQVWCYCEADVCLGDYSRKEVIRQWNSRPVEDALRARAEAAEAKWASVPWGTFCTILNDHPVEYDILREWFTANAPKEESKWLNTKTEAGK